MPSTGNGRLPIRNRITGHRVPATGRRRAADTPGLEPGDKQGRHEMVAAGAVILAGVLVVIAFGFAASRVMRTQHDEPNVAVPQAPALGEVTVPSGAASQGLIPLTSPSPSESPSLPTPTTPTTSPSVKNTTPAPDLGAITVTSGSVPARVDLAAEGTRDWVHWGLQSTYSTERDAKGGFAILEGAPTAPRYRDTLGSQQFSWTGGDPTGSSAGTNTGVHTCGEGNGFTLSAPAGTGTRTLRLYVGVIGARGKLTAGLSTGSVSTTTVFDQKDTSLRSIVVTLKYHAPKDGKLQLTWDTDQALATAWCSGVTLKAATLH